MDPITLTNSWETLPRAVGRNRFARMMSEEDGATAVEAAMVLPALFLMLFGLFAFLLVLFAFGNAVYASRTGARYASLHSATSLAPATLATVQEVVTPLLVAAPPGGVTISSAWTPANTIGGMVTVSVGIALPLSIPFMSSSHINVGSSARRSIVR